MAQEINRELTYAAFCRESASLVFSMTSFAYGEVGAPDTLLGRLGAPLILDFEIPSIAMTNLSDDAAAEP